jgi:hypothetical protein
LTPMPLGSGFDIFLLSAHSGRIRFPDIS